MVRGEGERAFQIRVSVSDTDILIYSSSGAMVGKGDLRNCFCECFWGKYEDILSSASV